MQKSKKHIFGLVGLTMVGAMFATALALPSPDAAAAETDVNVTVKVGETSLSVAFGAPQDGAILTNPEVEVSTNYSLATKLDFFLNYTNSDGQEVRIPVETFSPTEDSGVHNFILDLRRYPGSNNFRLTTIAYGASGDQREDTVSFQYRVMNATYEGVDEKGDPQIKAEVSTDVNKVQIQAYDKDGNALFVDKDGAEKPILVNRDQIDANGQVLITLPFAEYGVDPGDYTAVLVSYDADNNIIAINTVDFPYVLPGTPDVPATGIFVGDLNISRMDYLLTGLIAFGAVAGMAIYLICRKNRHDK